MQFTTPEQSKFIFLDLIIESACATLPHLLQICMFIVARLDGLMEVKSIELWHLIGSVFFCLRLQTQSDL